MAKKTYIPTAYKDAVALKNYIDRWSVTMKDNMDNDGHIETDALRAALVAFINATREYVIVNP